MFDGQGPYGSSYINLPSAPSPKPNHDRSSSFDQKPTMASKRQTPHHQRALTEDNPRPSLVKLRSRSNTSTSTHNVTASQKGFTLDASTDPPRPRPTADRPKSSYHKHDKSDGFRKGLKAKSSRLFRRPESVDELTSLGPLNWSDEFEDICPKVVEEDSPPATPKHSRKGSKSNATLHRYNISEPFNFQHLTHTDPSQFQQIAGAGHDDIVSEFSAMRASQAPRRQLQGIKTQDIQSREEHQAVGLVSSPPSPVRSNSSDAVYVLSREKLQHGLNMSPPRHSVPSFSYPARLSSLEPNQPEDEYPPTEPFPRIDTRAQEELEEVYDFGDESSDYPIATWADGVYNFEVPHAMTTPDDVAQTLQPPPFQVVRTGLSQVLEEDEFADGRRHSAAAPIHRSKAAISELRSSRSSPNIRRSGLRSVASVADYTATIVQDQDIRPPSVLEQPHNDVPYRPHSIEPKHPAMEGAEGTWEEDIDWCYNNEAEADCNFDWHRTSALKKLSASLQASGYAQTGLTVPNLVARNSHLRRPTRIPYRSSSIYSSSPSLIVPPQNMVPDLEPPSAVSAQSSLDSISEAATPTDSSEPGLSTISLSATCKPACQDWVENRASAPPVDPESTLVYEDSFHVIYARRSVPKQPSYMGQGDDWTDSSVSARSSRSQESFWSRRDNRSDSGGSIPDLIHSKVNNDWRGPASNQPLERQTYIPAPSTVTDAGQTVIQRRRSPSIAKEATYRSMYSRPGYYTHTESCDELPMPPKFSAYDRPNSDGGIRNFDTWAIPPPKRSQNVRSRSGSIAASIRSSSTTIFNPFPADPL